MARVSLFLSFADEQLLCNWQMVNDAGPWDILLLGLQSDRNTLAAPERYEVSMNDDTSAKGSLGHLNQPLKYDAFREALMGWDLQFVTLRALFKAGPDAGEEAQLPADSTPTPVGVEKPAGPALPLHARYRLRRWPPTELILTHRYHLRLASFLSVRSVSLEELAKLSNVDEASCETFLQTLRAAGLLAVTLTLPSGKAHSAAEKSPQAGHSAPSSKKAAGSEPGLIQRIRNALGIR